MMNNIKFICKIVRIDPIICKISRSVLWNLNIFQLISEKKYFGFHSKHVNFVKVKRESISEFIIYPFSEK